MSARLASLALVAAVFAPDYLAARHPLAAMCVRGFFAHLCHQLPGRSFAIDGTPLAVCVRCLGIYCGVAVAMCLPSGNIPARKVLAFALVANLADVCAEALHLYANLPLPRFCLGTVLGMAAGAVLVYAPTVVSINKEFGSKQFRSGG